MSDDTQARKQRAKRLQEEIDKLTKTPTLPKSALDADTQPISPAESPRDFIHRRMHELDDVETTKRKPRSKD